MKLRPSELVLEGRWNVVDGRIAPDDVAERVRSLARDVLERVASDASGWDTLYLDPADGRYWELTYPQGQMHGGGPPRLAVISVEQARAKYRV
ncbi:MAG TPA: Imm27 family immunity protein [Polyangiaceae bacterium]